MKSVGLVRALRIVFLLLALFDLGLGIALTFFSDDLVPALAPAGYAEPLFFQRCVGVFMFQYVFVQLLGFLDPRRWATALTMTVVLRSTFSATYLTQLVLWGSPFTVLHGMLAASALLDAATTIFIVVAMARLKIGLFQGDAVAPPRASGSKALRILLLVLAIAELCIGLGWFLLPKLLCDLYGITYAVDPFWARATGMLLMNIAFIQYLGSRDPNRYRSAALTSGVFRALWPILYWVSVAQGEGNGLFQLTLMFFSFFNIASCATIFWLVHRASAPVEARPQPALQPQAAAGA